jgi:hypothetical protein
MGDFLVMSILKGFGTATLYIVLGLYMTSGFPLNIVMHAGGMMIRVRSFLGSGIVTGVYSYLLYAASGLSSSLIDSLINNNKYEYIEIGKLTAA